MRAGLHWGLSGITRRNKLCLSLLGLLLALAGALGAGLADIPIQQRDFEVGVGYVPPEGMPKTEAFPFIADQDLADVVLFQRSVDWDGSRNILPDLAESVRLARQEGFKIFLAQDAIQAPKDYGSLPGQQECQRGEVGPFPDNWYNPSDPQYVPPDQRNFANAQVHEAFLNYHISLVRTLRPEYLSMGVEVDMYAFPCYPFVPEIYPNPDALTFQQKFKEDYNIIHQIAPDTEIFTTFQYTQIGFALISGAGSLLQKRWDFINGFKPRIDAVGLSDFPDTVYFLSGPSSMAPNWYSDISANSRTDLPIIFSEIGWPSAGTGGSPEWQKEFISVFLDRARSLDTLLVMWWFLADPVGEGFSPHFYHMGLFEKSYPAIVSKPALADWQALYRLPRATR